VQHQPILAAVDLGSNSFRLQIARVENDQLYMLDGLREPVRLAAGLNTDQHLDTEAQLRAFTALGRFAERLRGLPQEAVRTVGTNALRVAKNATDFIPQAEHVLGFPIEVIAGMEEARLIYIGVAHGLPQSEDNLLVMDIGGGSTEFIIGSGLTPLKLKSLHMGCVSYSLRFFSDGKITKQNLRQAEFAARNTLQTIVVDFNKGQWASALGSSGSARVLCDVLELNGYSENGITRDGLEKLRAYLLKTGDVQKLDLQGLRADRVPVFSGGFAIMYAAFCELKIEQMHPALGALREGVLYDLWGRFHNNDMREVTVQQFMRRYHVDARQAERVTKLACQFSRQFLGDEIDESMLHIMGWAARLHELGISIAHNGYHKHTAYILANADMPGFSKKEQARLSLLTLTQRGNLEKLKSQLKNAEDCALIMSLRLAVLFYRNRSNISLPALRGRFSGTKFHLSIDANWLTQNPLTEAALQEEVLQWEALKVSIQILSE
jgi:exopolyphosphatase/guanosine-5'-triphosphate,3'-diphosphate pyrophosphatase